ncbi:hypothetical protein IB260_05835 [Pseudomonas sp. PDM23]|uniref:hypothetical protein n=1 Tax=unclassified Pseudomonas TaxID=196821 RepID=UPI00177EE516|nr:MULTISPECIES: hypothetical protein [unclassified Pseudomonas]MBD9503766.1 hypothetical protein [Pseudomonas sp. PDM17]MBD9513691.1 hypothetical protein [Pseudomonas sp. PDM22]MBD9574824.1 hypothetical protein [Pseudomonas sp. PDM23]MBD9630004.1 hypothetical protein [Pseudomonas sp. PDM19]MBD9672973.1 hypothetical protein [Pseudomonas sp. PDM21]
MNERAFPGYDTWSLAKMNGDHALAFIAVQDQYEGSTPSFHLVYGLSCFGVMSQAFAAAEKALAKITRINRHGEPVFSSPDC